MLGPSLAAKTRVAMVGTGIRGVNMWGKNVQENYSDVVEFVGLSDINPGRLAFAERYIGARELIRIPHSSGGHGVATKGCRITSFAMRRDPILFDSAQVCAKVLCPRCSGSERARAFSRGGPSASRI